VLSGVSLGRGMCSAGLLGSGTAVSSMDALMSGFEHAVCAAVLGTNVMEL
jgi:hypothetical protein